MATEIDNIWESLRSDEVSSSTTSLLFAKRTSKRIVGDGSRRFDVKVIGQPFDIDAVPSSTREPSNRATKTKANNAGTGVILSGIDVTSASANFDSDDDESDNDEDTKEDTKTRLPRIERLARALCSDDVSARVQSLTQLKATIDALSLDCAIAPQLDYPPPYDDATIKLNKNLPVVSDLAKPKLLQTSEECTTLALKSIERPNKSIQSSSSNSSKVQLRAILDICGKNLFRLIGDDKSEKCRMLSVECLQTLLLAGIDGLGRHVPYLIPVLAARLPPCIYDKDMEVFVQNQQLHEFFKRGGATDRQDREGLVHSGSFQVIEPNEDLRLELIRTFDCLLRGVIDIGAERTLDAYYSEIIFALQTMLRDPFPEVKIQACHLLVQLLRVPHWEQGAKYFATGLARSALPNCRHRNTNVIVAALGLLEASVCVPNRTKVKGAGTQAISDLVGFREDNSIQVAAFYDAQCGVSVNTLAELASHKNHRVRLRTAKMLSYFLVYLPDRYDHHQRLLPYVLSFINEPYPNIQKAALECIDKCGLQYESEHPDEIIERRQFGVDGEDDIDYESNLPAPFTCRPSLGARLYVRANTSRFLLAVLSELSNWSKLTRKRSAELLLVLAVYSEEHLTKDFQQTINSIARAIEVEKESQHDNDHLQVMEKIRQVLFLMAQYVDPTTYLPLVCPRISGGGGDNSSGTSNTEDGSHSEKTRSCYAVILSSLIKGAPLKKLIPHWLCLASLLMSAGALGPFAGTITKRESLNAFLTLITRIQEDEKREFIAQFTQEQHKVQSTISKCTEVLSELLGTSSEDAELAKTCIGCLSKLNDAL